jgi:hypothetical protein
MLTLLLPLSLGCVQQLGPGAIFWDNWQDKDKLDDGTIAW